MELIDVDGHNHLLRSEAALDWHCLNEAAVAAGFAPIHVNSAGRSKEEQSVLYVAYIKACAEWERSGRMTPKPTPVAPPGGSEHQIYIAVDIAVASVPGLLQWLMKNSAKYNFWFTAAGERWHLAHYEGQPPQHLYERHLENLKAWSKLD